MQIRDQDRNRLREFLRKLEADARYNGFGLDQYKGNSPNQVRTAHTTFKKLGDGDPLGTVELWIAEHAADASVKYGVRGMFSSRGDSNPARHSFAIEPDDPGEATASAKLLRSTVEPFARQSAELLAELRRETGRRADDMKTSGAREVAARVGEAQATARAELLAEQLEDAEQNRLVGFVRGFTDDLDPEQRAQIGMLFGVSAQLAGGGIGNALGGVGDWFRSLAEKNRGGLSGSPRPDGLNRGD